MWQSIKNIFHLLQAIVAVIYFRFPARNLTVIGVTGTDGKTTTSTMIYHILKAAKLKTALISTIGAYLGEKSIDTGFHVTTPNSWQLQQLIHTIRSQGFTHLVLEATSHGLDQHRLFGANIQYAVVTNITHEHLDYHHTYPNYLQAKAKIFAQAKIAVINQLDSSYAKLKSYIPKTTQSITYTINPQVIAIFKETCNQANASAAFALTQALDILPETILAGLQQFTGIPGRMETIVNVRHLNVVVDFAHTPNGLSQALTALRKTTSGKLIAVFGAAGLRDASKRPLMGQIGAQLADEIVLTAEDPRSEDVKQIIRQIKAGITQNQGHVHAIIDRQAAINFAINTLAKPGDTVGIFGKGHERSMNLDGKTEIPWSDQALARSCLQISR